jgi:Flp pilus assembly protein protease CpaA
MIITPVLLTSLFIGLAALLVASWCDIRTREVPDWISFSLMTFAVGNATIISLYTNNYLFIINSVIGLAIGVGIGFFMFYTGQWGGGDSKLIMGLLALIGLNIKESLLSNSNLMVVFIINILLVGAFYGIIYSLVKAILNFKECKKAAQEKLKAKPLLITRIIIIIMVLGSLAYLVLSPSFDSAMIFGMCAFAFVLFYLWVVISCVEKTCMIKEVDVGSLTEGDWIVNPIMKNKKIILKPTKTGITREEIALLKKNSIRKATIKIGIPFVPSFLLAYIITFLVGNWLVLVLF